MGILKIAQDWGRIGRQKVFGLFCNATCTTALSCGCVDHTARPPSAKNKFAGRIMTFSASNAYILVVVRKSRRNGMAPAHILVFLSQKTSV